MDLEPKSGQQKKPELTFGTYWDEQLGRYVPPSDPEWNVHKFREVSKEK